jgi:hypothetical protein
MHKKAPRQSGGLEFIAYEKAFYLTETGMLTVSQSIASH